MSGQNKVIDCVVVALPPNIKVHVIWEEPQTLRDVAKQWGMAQAIQNKTTV